jgi:hypothetical protein
MAQFPVDDDLVELVWHRARPRPFENLNFNEALRRVLTGGTSTNEDGRKAASKRPQRTVDELLAEVGLLGKEELASRGIVITRRLRSPSPSAENWALTVPELRSVVGLRSWTAICDHLAIEVGADSARRKLQDWVRAKRPKWPPVPDA